MAVASCVLGFGRDPGRSSNPRKLQRSSEKILAYILVGIGILVLFRGGDPGTLANPHWHVLMTAAKTSYEQQVQKLVFSYVTVAEAMSSAPVVATPDMTLSHVISKIVLRQRYRFLPVVENGVLLCKIGRMVLRSIDREHWRSTKVDDVFVDLTKETLIAPDMKSTDLLELTGTLHQRSFSSQGVTGWLASFHLPT